MGIDRRSRMPGLEATYEPVLQLWMLRALVLCNGAVRFIGEKRFDDMTVARALGFTDPSLKNYSMEWAFNALTRKHAAMERKAPELPSDSVLARNMSKLARRLSLNDVEEKILHFTVLQRLQVEFSEALDLVGSLTKATVARLYATCLDLPLTDVRDALDDQGKLARSALLWVDKASLYDFHSKMEMPPGLAEELLVEHEDLLRVFASSVVEAPASTLSLANYPHLTKDLAILRSYLDAVGRLRQAGVNVLLYGRPGTGKTELVRALAHDLKVTLLEIPTEDPNGKPRTGKARFDSYRFAQGLLGDAGGNALLFDEVEDVFGALQKQEDGNVSGIKGWVNQLLEKNAVPTFWVTNHLKSIDPAYRRRFDFVLEVDVPPRSVRRSLLDEHIKGLSVSEEWRSSAAEHEDLAPAVVQRAAKVGEMVCDIDPNAHPAQVLSQVMNNTLRALGVGPLQSLSQTDVADYRLEYLNADQDLCELSAGLLNTGEGRLLLYGPPGTGKTAFGRHVAGVLDRPLLAKRASDLLSPYLGMTERNIARMFEEAIAEGAVLLVDEADSLLRDRGGAHRSWEVTQVNEMLTQLENFEGVFIASTNLLDTMDAAAMRRFDVKVKLGYLKPEQAWAMFESAARSLGHAAPLACRHALARLDCLSPGDFAALMRWAKLARPKSPLEIVERLRTMCQNKREPMARSIGFAA